MEFLTTKYLYNHNDSLWDGYVEQYPYITAKHHKNLADAQEALYILTTEEMYHLYKNLSSWQITKETIIYLQVDGEN